MYNLSKYIGYECRKGVGSVGQRKKEKKVQYCGPNDINVHPQKNPTLLSKH